MKIHNKYIWSGLASMLFLFVLTSCTEDTMDRINKNNNYPLDTEAKFIIADLEVSTAFRVVGGDFSLYSSVYMEHEVGVHNQMYNAEIRQGEPTSSSTYNNVWNSAYTNIRNAKIVIKKCDENGAEKGSNVSLGIGRVFLAYNAAVLTDLFGDIPYTQAGEIDETGLPVFRQPVVDKQEDVYKDVINQLDLAIADFPKGENGAYGVVGNKDFLYKGDSVSWRKVAYGLKARYAMRLLHKSTNKTADLNNIINYISKSFESADKEFKFNLYDGKAQYNPLFGFSDSRGALAASQSLVNKLKERNDPRLTLIIADPEDKGKVVTDPTKFSVAPNGTPQQVQYTYHHTVTNYSKSGATQYLSYHELLYLKAEAYARLGGAANVASAKIALKEAVAVGLANLQKSIETADFHDYTGYKADLSVAVSDAYFTADVEPLFNANPLKEIMNQKYLAFLGASGESIEAYNDYRRMLALGENLVTLENAKNTSLFPLRFVYGNSDVLANTNITSLVGDGTYVYKESVWWAGGTK